MLSQMKYKYRQMNNVRMNGGFNGNLAFHAKNQESLGVQFTAGFNSRENGGSSNSGEIHANYQFLSSKSGNSISSGSVYNNVVPQWNPPHLRESSSQKHPQNDLEHLFHKHYFENLIKQQNQAQDILQQVQANAIQTKFLNNYGELENQDFVSQQECQDEISSIKQDNDEVDSCPPENRDFIREHSQRMQRLLQQPVDNQINQIIETMERLNILTQNPARPAHSMNKDGSKSSLLSRSTSPNTMNNTQKSHTRNKELNKFLTTKTSSHLKTLPPALKSPVSTATARTSIKSIASPRRSISPKLMMTASPNTFKELARKIAKQQKSPLQKRSHERKKTPNKDEYINQELIQRLFIDHKRIKEVQDQKRCSQRQKEQSQMKDKPTISPRSREIALNSERFAKPIYSDVRYKQEIDKVNSKKEEAVRLKYMMQRDKEISEQQEMVQNSVHKNVVDCKLDRGDFIRKYNQQVRLWEARVKGQVKTCHQDQYLEENSNFKPTINHKSKVLAMKIEKIEKRVEQLQQQKKRNIEIMTVQSQNSFTPSINTRSEQLAHERRRKQPTKVPLLTQYLNVGDQENRQSTERLRDIVARSSSGHAIKSKSPQKPKQRRPATAITTHPHIEFARKSLDKEYSPISLLSKTRNTEKHTKVISNIYQDFQPLQTMQHRFTIEPKMRQPSLAQIGIANLATQQEGQSDYVIHRENNDDQLYDQQDESESDLTMSKQTTQYVYGILQSTENMQQYLHTYMRESIVEQAEELQQPLIAGSSSEEFGILQEYFKLRKEFDEQMSARVSLANTQPLQVQILDETESQGSVQDIQVRRLTMNESQSVATIVVNPSLRQLCQHPHLTSMGNLSCENNSQTVIMGKCNDAFVDDSPINIEVQQQSIQEAQSENSNFQSRTSSHSQHHRSYRKYLLQTKPLEPQPAPNAIIHQYQTSPMPDKQQTYTLTSSADTSAAVDFKNFQLSALQENHHKSLSQLKMSPVKLQNSLQGSENSREIQEVENILQNIKQSIEIIACKMKQPSGLNATVMECENESRDDSALNEGDQQESQGSCGLPVLNSESDRNDLGTKIEGLLKSNQAKQSPQKQVRDSLESYQYFVHQTEDPSQHSNYLLHIDQSPPSESEHDQRGNVIGQYLNEATVNLIQQHTEWCNNGKIDQDIVSRIVSNNKSQIKISISREDLCEIIERGLDLIEIVLSVVRQRSIKEVNEMDFLTFNNKY
ncbi:hypothetical protein FGO68_gene15281 [Halteria grandinella]|uniref:Uncharacterized protein n=1 Tax=Halteria grandinella TaxID=5974 RepID=A0A8J8SXS8_HALGN|nr:hypothetical protein FGO68_gene15281 [Halteria grandinella]